MLMNSKRIKSYASSYWLDVIHTHTHTHTYVCMYLFVCSTGFIDMKFMNLIQFILYYSRTS